jgi:hypothetical protein|tara:strand:+ start:6243 stop:7994 length:1752 start_codon:yes stop_codon:yes gene_type:complete
MAEIIIADASPRVLYTVGSTPTTGPWSIPWPYYASSDILVYFDDTLKTISTDYTIAGNAVDDGFSGGAITAASNQSNIVITIKRDIPVARTTDFPPSGVFNIATLNKDLDRMYAVGQQLEEILARALQLSVTSAASISGILPEPEANKVFGWNAAATAIVNVSTVGNFQGAWETSTAYIVNDIITINGNSYICITANTSGVFTTDLAAEKWSILSQKGNTGNVAGLEFAYEDTNTDTDQGAGKVWFDTDTLANVAIVYVDDVDVNAVNINSFVDTWDDSTASINGMLQIVESSNNSNFAIYNVTGSVTSASTYSKVAVTHVASGGSFTDGSNVSLNFTRSGDDGATGPAATIAVGSVSTGGIGSSVTVANAGSTSEAVFNFSIPVGATGATGSTGSQGPAGEMGGPSSSTDNAIARFNGTSGSEVQNTGWTISDGNALAAGGVFDMSGHAITLDAVTLSGAVTGADQIVSAINLKDYGEVTQDLGSAGGTRTVNLNNGNSVTATVSASANTFVFSNPTASDELCGFTLGLTNGGSQTVNWPSTVDWTAATAPTLTALGVDWLVFWTVDGGTIWNGKLVGAAFA